MKVGLQQGPALSPHLSAIVMNELTKDVRIEIGLHMMHADDVTRVKSEEWRDEGTHERKGLQS